MKITLPEKWGCEDPRADEAVYRKAYLFVKKWNTCESWDDQLSAITSFFMNYENMYQFSYSKHAMKVEVAHNVVTFAYETGRTRGIDLDVIEGLWKKVFGREIWEFTGNYSPFSKRQMALQKTWK